MSDLSFLLVVGAVFLIYLFRGFIKKILAIGVMLIIATVAIFLMYGGTSDPKVLPDFMQQIVSAANQIVVKAEASKTVAVGVNSTAIIDSASLVVTHNKWRSQVGVPPLGWSDGLAKSAQVWADELKKKTCAMVHANQNQYGENIFWASATRWSDGSREVQDISAKLVVDDLASEVLDYNYEANSCAPGKMCGHYTQIVWRDTEEVGCAKAICDDKSQVWVCRYSPHGNIVGEKPY